MDTARYAAMADPDRNPHFRRRWESPPLELQNPLAGGTAQGATLRSGSMFKHLAYAEKVFKNFTTFGEENSSS
jgi:hypothetical protein